MTNPEKVHDFFKKNLHRFFCDDCIETKTGVDRHEVNSNRDKMATEAL